jgi:alkanesulfonate monooxygenase SsuD/methylene tetrahydromethanopterin reductase-like flavin-dependent oxidoreductase (luciferase family)
MNVVSHIYHGLWRHPDSTQMHFDKLSTWIELTKILEKGGFDALFLADVIGIDPAYKGSWDTYVSRQRQCRPARNALAEIIFVLHPISPSSSARFGSDLSRPFALDEFVIRKSAPAQ